MTWLLTALSSSVGKKLVMGITGLLLCGFLVIHMSGNVLMFAGEEVYNGYAHTLHSQEWFIKIAEFGLAILFGLHIYLAIATTRMNRKARRRSYAEKESKIDNAVLNMRARAENWMFLSGAIVLGFLIWHISDFTLQITPTAKYAIEQEYEPFDKAKTILMNPPTAVAYVIGCVFLAWHLSHGVSSAFQSLGINHSKYNRLIRILGVMFAVVFGLGFLVFPIAVWAGWI